MVKKIAIIGSGISGLTSAYLLSQEYEVHVFEANDYIGGHACTIDFPLDNKILTLDTGFMVFNKKTYPNFYTILEKEKVPIEPSNMSFSYESAVTGLSYNGHTVFSLFSDRKNLFSFTFYEMLYNILKFNLIAKKELKRNEKLHETLSNFFQQHDFCEVFKEAYLIPIISAVWSCQPTKALDFPLKFLLGFLENHGLLDVFFRPQWYVIQGGSRNYVNRLTRRFKDNIYLNTQVKKLIRSPKGVELITNDGSHFFDKIIIATHSDTALELLEQPTELEKSLLSSIKYTSNHVVLHQDASVLPSIKGNWASWNFLDLGNAHCSLTYYLNQLQNLQTKEHFCVSVNLAHKIDRSKIIKEFTYSHPAYTQKSILAQNRYHEINGKNHTYYCGAYWGYGFHEDGVNSAINACQALKGFS